MMRWTKELMLLWKITLKRLCKRKGFWFVLFLTPILLVGLWRLEKDTSSQINAVVYCQDDFWRERLSRATNPSFYFVDSLEELRYEVLTGKAECGYEIPDNLLQAFETEDWSWKIRVYEGPQSLFTNLVNEAMFAVVFEAVSYQWYVDFVQEGASHQERMEITKLLTEKVAEGATFEIQKVYGAKEALLKEPTHQGFLSGVKLVAIMIYFLSLISVLDVCRDREKGYFKAGQRKVAALFTLWHPAILVGITGYAGMLIVHMASGKEWSFTAEFGNLRTLFVLMIVTTLYGYVLSFLVRKAKYLYGLIPLLLMGSLVCCPIFVDLSTYIPVFSYIKWLFPLAFCV